MNNEERAEIEARVKKLQAEVTVYSKPPVGPIMQRTIHRLEGNIGALEWVLRNFDRKERAS